MRTYSLIDFSSLNFFIVSISKHNGNQMDCKILLSLLQEGKPSKIASKLGFLAPGLKKWTEFHPCK